MHDRVQWLWRVELPKTLVIADWRPALIYRLLQATVVLGIAFMLASGVGYLKYEQAPLAAVRLWSDAGTFDPLSDSPPPSYCDNPDTDYEPSAALNFSQNGCVRPVHHGLVVDQEGPSTLFFTTYVDSVLQLRGADCGCAAGSSCGCRRSARHFIVGVEELRLNLQAYYAMDQDWRGETYSTDGAAWKHPTVRLFPSGSDLAAVGSDDAIWEKPAGVPVSFGVAELLSLAGVSLDSRWSGGGADAQGRTPLHRLSGVILNLRVHFKGQYEQQTYCDLAIEATRTWTSRGWRALRPLQSALGLQADAILSSAIVSTAIVSSAIVSTAIVSGAIASTLVGARCLSG